MSWPRTRWTSDRGHWSVDSDFTCFNSMAGRNSPPTCVKFQKSDHPFHSRRGPSPQSIAEPLPTLSLQNFQNHIAMSRPLPSRSTLLGKRSATPGEHSPRCPLQAGCFVHFISRFLFVSAPGRPANHFLPEATFLHVQRSHLLRFFRATLHDN